MLPQYTLLLLAAVIPKALSTAAPADEAITHPNIPQDFIDQVMASFTTDEDGQLVSRAELHKRTLASRGLEKRVVPVDNTCGNGEWQARYCMSDVGPREWHDRCLINGQIQWIGGICPEYTFCTEEFDDDGDDVITCTPSTPPQQDNVGSTRRGRNKQYGYRPIQPKASRGANQHLESIALLLGIQEASVTGHLRSTDRTFIIDPVNILKANLRGFNYNLCKSSTNQGLAASYRNSRTCNPTTINTFSKGDNIDFTWGFSNFQSGLLFYSIDP